MSAPVSIGLIGAGIMGERMNGFALNKAGGLYSRMPWLAAIALVLLLSVSGLPPFSGLWPKAYLVKASLDVGAWWLAFAILLTGLMTTIAVGRTFAFSFWRERTGGEAETASPQGAVSGAVVGSLVGLTLLTVAVGIYPEPVIRVTDRIAGELLAPAGYVDSVFPADMTPTQGEGGPQEGETQQ